MRRPDPIAALACLLVAACGGAERTSDRRSVGCTPNQTAACLCAPGVQGVQVCQSDFTFTACACDDFDAGTAADDAGEAEDSAVVEDAGFADAEVPPDAGFPDAGFVDVGFPDSGVPLDAGFPDSGVPPDAGFIDAGFPDSGVRPDAGFPDAGFPDSGVATDAGTPACTSDGQCASGRCHPLYNQCVPANRKLDCEVCNSDSECGLAADHCLDVTIGGVPAERICAQGCNQDSECPRGYECSLSNHCYPIPGTIRVHTCASIRDTLAATTCDALISTDQCGLPNLDDGTCVFGLGCSVGCFSDAQCPSGTTCTNWFVGDFCQP